MMTRCPVFSLSNWCLFSESFILYAWEGVGRDEIGYGAGPSGGRVSYIVLPSLHYFHSPNSRPSLQVCYIVTASVNSTPYRMMEEIMNLSSEATPPGSRMPSNPWAVSGLICPLVLLMTPAAGTWKSGTCVTACWRRQLRLLVFLPYPLLLGFPILSFAHCTKRQFTRESNTRHTNQYLT